MIVFYITYYKAFQFWLSNVSFMLPFPKCCSFMKSTTIEMLFWKSFNSLFIAHLMEKKYNSNTILAFKSVLLCMGHEELQDFSSSVEKHDFKQLSICLYPIHRIKHFRLTAGKADDWQRQCTVLRLRLNNYYLNYWSIRRNRGKLAHN